MTTSPNQPPAPELPIRIPMATGSAPWMPSDSAGVREPGEETTARTTPLPGAGAQDQPQRSLFAALGTRRAR